MLDEEIEAAIFAHTGSSTERVAIVKEEATRDTTNLRDVTKNIAGGIIPRCDLLGLLYQCISHLEYQRYISGHISVSATSSPIGSNKLACDLGAPRRSCRIRKAENEVGRGVLQHRHLERSRPLNL